MKHLLVLLVLVLTLSCKNPILGNSTVSGEVYLCFGPTMVSKFMIPKKYIDRDLFNENFSWKEGMYYQVFDSISANVHGFHGYVKGYFYSKNKDTQVVYEQSFTLPNVWYASLKEKNFAIYLKIEEW